jgi:hypothetical protein
MRDPIWRDVRADEYRLRSPPIYVVASGPDPGNVESGSYQYTRNEFSLTFNSSGGTLVYDLVPAS